jgi:hypothetical protein
VPRVRSPQSRRAEYGVWGETTPKERSNSARASWPEQQESLHPPSQGRGRWLGGLPATLRLARMRPLLRSSLRRAVFLQADHLGVMHKAIDHRGGHRRVPQHLTPAPEGFVRGHDHAGAFVARRHELEEQVCSLRLKGDVADLVDDQQRRAPEADELIVQEILVVRLAQTIDPLCCGPERDPVAGQIVGIYLFRDEDAARRSAPGPPCPRHLTRDAGQPSIPCSFLCGGCSNLPKWCWDREKVYSNGVASEGPGIPNEGEEITLSS